MTTEVQEQAAAEQPEPAAPEQQEQASARDDGQQPAEDDCRPRRRIRVGSPAALLAAVPLLMKFRPARSVVIIGTEAPRSDVRMTMRYDLPDLASPAAAARLVRHALEVLEREGVKVAFAVGYGPDDLVAPIAAALLAAGPGIAVAEFLRVEHGRYWSYVCTNPECCPPEGSPFTEAAEPPDAHAACPGPPVLASREELAATVAADPDAAPAMRDATRQAERLLGDLAEHARESDPVTADRAIAAPGLQATGKAIACYRDDGEPLPHDDIAMLTVTLRNLRVRDDAWARMDPEHNAAHRRLWTDATRLAQPGYVAAPATLLAFTAWQSGDGALANVALDRALADNPRYSMAVLMRDVLDGGAPPALARPPMTPEEVAAAYDAQCAGSAGRCTGGPGCADACAGDSCGPCDEAVNCADGCADDCGAAPCEEPADQQSEPEPATATA
jgi:hypothetical protein